MDIPITDRRKEIGDMFRKNNFVGLSKFGIEMIGGAEDFDCANYVAYRLIGKAPPFIVDVLKRIPKSDEPQQGLVFYGNGHGRGFVPLHYGIFKDGLVESKWDKGPVFKHKLEDVPDHYGSVAMFRSLDEDLYLSLQEAIHGVR
ncbi:hypothetical protein KY319_03195 [Candidatus Woesearchaeota archaeon]|nr:hypothetical protein [Candidatus Woesearchaeota archaeon]